jgi:hypothetical protein
MQCMQCEFFRGNSVLVDSKKSWPTVEHYLDTVGVWGSNPHAPTNAFNDLAPLNAFAVKPITPF